MDNQLGLISASKWQWILPFFVIIDTKTINRINSNLKKSTSDISLNHSLFTPPTVRLADGGGPHEGRVEVFNPYTNSWGCICDDAHPSDGCDSADHCNNNMANVTCQMLGYSSGIVKVDTNFGPGKEYTVMQHVRCDGTERSLLDCTYTDWFQRKSTHCRDAAIGVTCS